MSNILQAGPDVVYGFGWSRLKFGKDGIIPDLPNDVKPEKTGKHQKARYLKAEFVMPQEHIREGGGDM